MSRVFAYSATQAGIERLARARQAQRRSAVILRFEAPQRHAYTPLRVPSAYEVSRARHLAFLAGIDIATQTPAKTLIARVAAWHDLSYQEIIEHSRFPHIVAARAECVVAVWQAYPSSTLEDIARLFDRDASSVVLALRKAGLK